VEAPKEECASSDCIRQQRHIALKTEQIGGNKDGAADANNDKGNRHQVFTDINSLHPDR